MTVTLVAEPSGVMCLLSLPQAITLLAEAPEGRRWLQHLVNRVGGGGVGKRGGAEVGGVREGRGWDTVGGAGQAGWGKEGGAGLDTVGGAGWGKEGAGQGGWGEGGDVTRLSVMGCCPVPGRLTSPDKRREPVH